MMKTATLVLLKLFINTNEKCHTIDVPRAWVELSFLNKTKDIKNAQRSQVKYKLNNSESYLYSRCVTLEKVSSLQ